MSETSELSKQSWILEVRQRMAAPLVRAGVPDVAAGAGAGGGNGGGTGATAGGNGDKAAEIRPGAAALVALYVDAGQLWTLLTVRVPPRPGLVSSLSFPGALVLEDEEPWEAARRGAQLEAGLEPQVLLELGVLEPVTTPAGLVVRPFAAALPEAAVRKREDPAEEAGVEDVVPFPLRALSSPDLVESREVTAGDQVQQLAIHHVGRHRYWGVTAVILEELLVRLGLGAPAPPGA